jgi:hypothetical protein
MREHIDEMRQGRAGAWSKWRELISEQNQSGQSVAVFCRERDLRVWQFYEWKKQVRHSEAEKFVEVRVGAPAKAERPTQAESGSIEIRLDRGCSLVVGRGFDANHLRALLAVLEAEV